MERSKNREKEEEIKRIAEEEERKRDPFGFDSGFKPGNSFVAGADDIVNFVYDRDKK